MLLLLHDIAGGHQRRHRVQILRGDLDELLQHLHILGPGLIAKQELGQRLQHLWPPGLQLPRLIQGLPGLLCMGEVLVLHLGELDQQGRHLLLGGFALLGVADLGLEEVHCLVRPRSGDEHPGQGLLQLRVLLAGDPGLLQEVHCRVQVSLLLVGQGQLHQQGLAGLRIVSGGLDALLEVLHQCLDLPLGRVQPGECGQGLLILRGLLQHTL